MPTTVLWDLRCVLAASSMRLARRKRKSAQWRPPEQDPPGEALEVLEEKRWDILWHIFCFQPPKCWERNMCTLYLSVYPSHLLKKRVCLIVWQQRNYTLKKSQKLRNAILTLWGTADMQRDNILKRFCVTWLELHVHALYTALFLRCYFCDFGLVRKFVRG